jgi:hypothetical protein
MHLIKSIIALLLSAPVINACELKQLKKNNLPHNSKKHSAHNHLAEKRTSNPASMRVHTMAVG